MQLYEQIEKEFDEKFPKLDKEVYKNFPCGTCNNQFCKCNDVKSFLKQSFIKFLESECEMLMELDVSCVDDRLLGKSDEYLQGYNTSTDRWREQRDNKIKDYQNMIKELHG